MNLSTKGFPHRDAQFHPSTKVTSLNPNAAEFVPSALRSTFGSAEIADPSLDLSESKISENSDEEAHHFWRSQLPDDLISDFKDTGEDEAQKSEQLFLAGLSLNDQNVYLRNVDKLSSTKKIGFSGATFAEDQPSSALMTLATNNWNKRSINDDHQFINGREGHHHHKADSSAGFSNLIREHALENATRNSLEFLASQFPGLSTMVLSDAYLANRCDLNSTMNMLTQIQVDASLSQNLLSKALLTLADSHSGTLQTSDAYGLYPSSLPRGTSTFASTARKLVSQDSGHFKYERYGSEDVSVGSSRNSQLITSSYNGNSKSVLENKLQNFGVMRAAPAWLETRDAVDSREGGHDFASLRNVCLEQAKQAYLNGNEALAKELTLKGQMYSIQMKTAHGKARDTTYQQRNPTAPEVQSYIRGQNHLIDLHGLHVSEAIHVLKHELSILRRTARSAMQRLQVMVCLGPGHQPKGPRTPARLLVAVEQYLMEEGLPYSQPQPGLLRVLVY